jgi:hypothetical protein
MDLMAKRISLLSQHRFFDGYQRRLPAMMYRAVKNILRENPTADVADVHRTVVKEFELTPLEIGPLHAISLEVEERPYLSPWGVVGSAYHAEAIVDYSGSSRLWTARPHNDFDWGMAGIVQRDQVRLHVINDSKDWDGIERLMTREFAAARKAVNGFSPTVIMFNVRIAPLMEPLVRTYVERLRAQDVPQGEYEAENDQEG